MKKFLLRMGLIAGFAAALYPIPALFIVRENQNTSLALWITGMLILAAWLGTALQLLLFSRYRKHPRLIACSFWLGTILLLAVGTYGLPYPAMRFRVYCGILLGGCFYAGTRLAIQPLERLSRPFVRIAVCTVDVVLGLICRVYDPEMSIIPILCILIGNAILSLLANNLQAFEQLLFRDRAKIQKVPKEIHRSNFRMMAILCVICAAIPLLGVPAARLLRWIGCWIAVGAWYLLYWLFASKNDTTEETAPPETVTAQLQTVEQNTAADWVWLITEIVVGVSVALLVIWKCREIGHAIQDAWHGLRRWAAMRFGRKTVPQEEAAAYYDKVEDLWTTGADKILPQRTMTRRSWNRSYRRYLRMPQQAARYRLGYALALARLPEDLAHDSDSTGQILVHLQKTGRAEPYWFDVTDHYDAVRYGAYAPCAADFVALDAMLREMKDSREK